MTQPDAQRLAEGERLIRAAFETARSRGIRDWRRMTSAVLKNRLLSLTDRGFDESDWNVGSFRAFLALYPDLLSVDDGSSHPPQVVLQEQDGEQTGADDGIAALTPWDRVRRDLWRAVLDYSSGRAYVWDEALLAAVPAGEDDPRPALPQVSQEAFAEWRKEFVTEQLPRIPPKDIATIEAWRDHALPSRALPVPTRGLWNEFLKRRVIALLREWFTANDVAEPPDLVHKADPNRADTPFEAHALRQFIQACVEVMTREELEGLLLPAAAVLRVRTSARRSQDAR